MNFPQSCPAWIFARSRAPRSGRAGRNPARVRRKTHARHARRHACKHALAHARAHAHAHARAHACARARTRTWTRTDADTAQWIPTPASARFGRSAPAAPAGRHRRSENPTITAEPGKGMLHRRASSEPARQRAASRPAICCSRSGGVALPRDLPEAPNRTSRWDLENKSGGLRRSWLGSARHRPGKD